MSNSTVNRRQPPLVKLMYTTEYSSKSLHLPIRTLATWQSSYLYNLLQLHQPSRGLRSSTQLLLQIPYIFTDFGRRVFSYSTPATSNSIPTSVKNCTSLYSFKLHLKSHLIAQLTNNNTHPIWPPGDLPALPIHARCKFSYYYYYYCYYYRLIC